MLYAREFYFSGDQQWFCHLRLDSSPQFAKNYLLGELDKVSFPGSIRSNLADTYLLVKDKLLFFGKSKSELQLGMFVDTVVLKSHGSSFVANISA